MVRLTLFRGSTTKGFCGRERDLPQFQTQGKVGIYSLGADWGRRHVSRWKIIKRKHQDQVVDSC